MTYECTYPGCDATFEVTEHFGVSLPVLDSFGEIIGWHHVGDGHEKPIDPAIVAHFAAVHPRDIEAAEARRAKAMAEVDRIHREWFPEAGT